MNRVPTDTVPLFDFVSGALPRGGAAVHEHHLAQFGEWLRAGAEPRLSLALLSGPAARARFLHAMSSQGADLVERICTPEQPLPAELLAHEGTHFNRTLFVLRGFDGPSAVELFALISGRRGLLTKVATWVTIVVEDTAALTALATEAPGLLDSVMRRLVVIDPTDPLDQAQPTEAGVAALRASQRTAELGFICARRAGSPEVALDWPLLVQSGYESAVLARGSAALRGIAALSRGASGEGLDPTLVPPLARLLVGARGCLEDVAQVEATHGPLIAALAARRAEVEVDSALAGLLNAAAAGDPGAFEVLRDRSDAAAVASVLDAMEAEIHAERGEIEGCLGALARIADDSRRAEPARFEALERSLQIQLYLGERGAAQRSRERCEALADSMQSVPHHGLALLARAAQIGALDAGRARVDRQGAVAFFKRHGLTGLLQRAQDAP